MKKIVFLACLFSLMRASAQFETAKAQPSFVSYTQRFSANSIVGKKIGYTDYDPNPAFVTRKGMADGDALSLAELMMKNPSLLRLSRDIPNLIFTSSGMVFITYLDDEWKYIFFSKKVESEITAFHKGCRVFWLV